MERDAFEFPQRNQASRKSIRERSVSKLNRSSNSRSHFQSEYNFPSIEPSLTSEKQGFEFYKSLPKLDNFSVNRENYYFKNNDETRSIDIYDDSEMELNTLPRSNPKQLFKTNRFPRNDDFRGSRKSVTFDRQVKVKYDHMMEMAESYATESSRSESDGSNVSNVSNVSEFSDISKSSFEGEISKSSEEHVYESIDIGDTNMVRYEDLVDERSAHMDTLQMYYKLQDEFVRLQRAQKSFKEQGRELKKRIPKRTFNAAKSFDDFMGTM